MGHCFVRITLNYSFRPVLGATTSISAHHLLFAHRPSLTISLPLQVDLLAHKPVLCGDIHLVPQLIVSQRWESSLDIVAEACLGRTEVPVTFRVEVQLVIAKNRHIDTVCGND